MPQFKQCVNELSAVYVPGSLERCEWKTQPNSKFFYHRCGKSRTSYCRALLKVWLYIPKSFCGQRRLSEVSKHS